MKKQHQKRSGRNGTAWDDDNFDARQRRGAKGLMPGKRVRPQDLRFTDDY